MSFIMDYLPNPSEDYGRGVRHDSPSAREALPAGVRGNGGGGK